MNVTFKLTAATSGTTVAGPFNISGTTNANVVSSLATGITKNQLTTGHTINSVNDAITGGTIASTGTCTNTIPWYVVQTATLAWTFSELGGARGRMDLYVNGSIVVTRSSTSSGTYTVNVGDTINVEVNTDECGLNFAYSECSGIIDDFDCPVAGQIANIVTSVYTVQVSDVGTTLSLDCLSQCSQTGCA